MSLHTLWDATISTDEYTYVTVLDTSQEPPVEVQLVEINFKGLKDIVANGDPDLTSWVAYYLGTFPEDTPDDQIVLETGTDGMTEV